MSDSNKDKEHISFTEAEVRFIKKLDERRVSAEARFPLITALFATFGLVSLFYGFEKLIDNVQFLSENPTILLVMGLLILAVTGTIYKKLN